MRITEPLIYILGVALAITYYLEEFVWCLLLVILIIATVILAAIFDGIRFFQWIFLVAFTA